MCSSLCSLGLLNDSGCRFRTLRQRPEVVGGSTAGGCGDCCDGENDVENGVTPIKTRLLRKCQNSGSDIMLEILEDCIVFFNKRIYISALYRRHKCAVQISIVQVQVCYTSKAVGPKAHNKT